MAMAAPRPKHKYDDEAIIAAVEAAIRKGASREDACHAAGVSPRAVYAWTQRGDREAERIAALVVDNVDDHIDPRERPFVVIRARLIAAEAHAKIEAVDCIRTAIVGWDEETTTVVTKEIAYEVDGEVVSAVQTQTTTKLAHKFSWAAAMTWLERRYPAEWARLFRSEIPEVRGDDIDTDKADVVELADRLLERRRQREVAEAQAHSGNGQAAE